MKLIKIQFSADDSTMFLNQEHIISVEQVVASMTITMSDGTIHNNVCLMKEVDSWEFPKGNI